MKVIVGILALSLFAGCDRAPKTSPPVDDKPKATWLDSANDKTLSLQDRLTYCETYFNATKKGSELVDPLRAIINDKSAWAYTPRISTLLFRMGPAAAPLKDDLLKKQDASPNSQSRRWQDCIDAIKE